jgi:hypothetical protein
MKHMKKLRKEFLYSITSHHDLREYDESGAVFDANPSNVGYTPLTQMCKGNGRGRAQ